MTDVNTETEIATYEISPFSKSKCLHLLKQAYGPTTRIFQRPGLMRLIVDNKSLVEVRGPHTGLPWALVQVGYDRLGFKCIIEGNKVFVEAKERVSNGPGKDVQQMQEDKTGEELREDTGQVPA